MEIRKIVKLEEIVLQEAGIALEAPIHKAAVLAIVRDPNAGKFVEDLQEYIDFGGVLGFQLTKIAMEILGDKKIESFGKGAIVGANCELEHGAAMNHVKFGNYMRQALGFPCKTIIPSTLVRGGLGTTLTVPLVHREANLVRSHFDAMEVRAADAPMADEIVVAAVFADGGRPLPRLGGLTKDQIVGDGIR